MTVDTASLASAGLYFSIARGLSPSDAARLSFRHLVESGTV